MRKELAFLYTMLAVSMVFFAAMPMTTHPSLHLMVLAVLSVTIGCKHHLLLSRDTKTADGKVSVQRAEQEGVSEDDAYWFPITGSCVLFGAFLVFKFLAKEWVKYLLMLFITFLCIGGLGTNFEQIVHLFSRVGSTIIMDLPYIGTISYLELPCFTLSLCIGVAYALTRHWALNNLMGVSFCVMGMKLMNLNSYKAGAIMFVGLFLYDIFWVFGSKSVFGDNVMVTVATGLNAPIKLMFPREGNATETAAGEMKFSMLGLGDIVVPGLFINVLVRLDAHLGKGRKYFNSAIVAYVLSLVTTVAVMTVFKAAQPALLYIVPFLFASSLAVAVVNGEFTTLIGFKCEDEDEDKGREGVQQAADNKKID